MRDVHARALTRAPARLSNARGLEMGDAMCELSSMDDARMCNVKSFPQKYGSLILTFRSRVVRNRIIIMILP